MVPESRVDTRCVADDTPHKTIFPSRLQSQDVPPFSSHNPHNRPSRTWNRRTEDGLGGTLSYRSQVGPVGSVFVRNGRLRPGNNYIYIKDSLT